MLWTGRLVDGDEARSFAELREAWREPSNKVFLIRGGPPDEPSMRSLYERHLADIGTAHYLAEDVTLGDRDSQRSGGLWTDVRYDPAHPDAYRHSPNAQPLHTDGSYVPSYPNATMMLCFSAAGEGGETIFIAADDVVAALKAEAPDLLDALDDHDLAHARSGDRRVEPVIDRSGNPTLVNWNFYCVADDIDAADAHLRDRYFAFLAESPAIRDRLLQIRMEPGDAVLWKDREVLHGRNAFSGHETSVRHLTKCAIDVDVMDGQAAG